MDRQVHNYYGPESYGKYIPESADYKMMWYKYLIYFGLFAGAFRNLIGGIGFLNGLLWGENKKTVYSLYGSLMILDVFVGLLLIGLAVFGIVTRFALSGYKSVAPVYVSVLFGATPVVNLIYVIGLYICLGAAANKIQAELNSVTFDALLKLAGGVMMVFFNKNYFEKRKKLFIN